eukprot:283214_1
MGCIKSRLPVAEVAAANILINENCTSNNKTVFASPSMNNTIVTNQNANDIDKLTTVNGVTKQNNSTKKKKKMKKPKSKSIFRLPSTDNSNKTIKPTSVVETEVIIDNSHIQLEGFDAFTSRRWDLHFTQYLITFGYIRQIGLYIPGEIYELCFVFYFPKEYFDNVTSHEDITISTDGLECSSDSSECNVWKSAFGVIECKNNQIHHWKIAVLEINQQLNAKNRYNWMCGIILCNAFAKHLAKRTYFTDRHDGYGIRCDDTRCDQSVMNSTNFVTYGECFGNEGNVVEIYFDCKTDAYLNKLSFKVNNNEYGISHEFQKSKNDSYCLAVSLVINSGD